MSNGIKHQQMSNVIRSLQDIRVYHFVNLAIHIFLQLSMPNGKNGVNGPNAQLLVGKDPKSGPVHAVNRPLEAMISVLEIQQRPGIVAQLNAKVTLKLNN